MVAESVPNSKIVGPMYLSEQAHRNLVDFVVTPRDSAALVVLGPPKSSKTAVLFEVLPRMVAARPNGLDPVFVRLALSLDDTPLLSAQNIWHALKRVALAFDVQKVDVPAVVKFDDARREIPILIRELALQFEKNANRQLWLLIDEISVRLFCA